MNARNPCAIPPFVQSPLPAHLRHSQSTALDLSEPSRFALLTGGKGEKTIRLKG